MRLTFKHLLAAAIGAFLGLGATVAKAEVQGQATEFISPTGLRETCVRLNPIPGGDYKKKDAEQEAFFCSIDLNGPTTALCPKTWSTSAGTMIYSTEDSRLTPTQYEAAKCTSRSGHAKIGKFKNTMNTPKTSATFSTSPLLYYHLSRYFDTATDIPVAVYRTIDKDAHRARVSSKGQGQSAMNRAAWEMMRVAEKNPAAYSPQDDLFTADRRQIYGVMLRDRGERYGSEFNGTRASGWGKGQNNDFQKTPGFMALRSEKPLKEAIAEGTKLSLQDSAMKAAVGGSLSSVQVVYWMKEITEITLLDYILSQQDRIGNIDFQWMWVYVKDGQVESQKVKDDRYQSLPRTKMSSIPVPAELKSFSPVLVQRTSTGDNDAGGKVQYANFTKSTQMLEKIRHYNVEMYRKLIGLKNDFAAQGPIYQHLKSTFGLGSRDFQMLVGNTQLAANIIQSTCRAGKLRFDLDPKDFILGTNVEQTVNCDAP